MKKLIISGLAMFMSLTSVMAQEETGIGNHLGWGVGFGTEGFNASIATDLTQYAELEFGVNYAPGFSRKSNGGVFYLDDAKLKAKENPRAYTNDEINVKTSINRATLDFKGSVYPFATNENFTSDLFVSLGISFASKEIATIKGSTKITGNQPAFAPTVDEEHPFVRAGKFLLPVEKVNGQFVANGSCQVNSVRPYVGLGYGRLVPKNNLGFRVEAGCQFAGSVKVYDHNDKETHLLSEYKIEDDSTPKKFMDFFSVYPVLKVSLRGKFF